MLDNKQKTQLEKFKIFSRWMYGDCNGSLYKAGAQFLVAMALFNYVETLGAFLIGYFQKDSNNQIKRCNCTNECSRCKDGQLRTSSRERFDAFFCYLGQSYKELLDKQPEIYDELRCGLTHEFLPKNRKFSIAKAPEGFTEEQIDTIKVLNFKNEFTKELNCGVFFLSTWFIFVPKLARDFEIAVKKITTEVETGNDQRLINNFFEAANNINLENFE